MELAIAPSFFKVGAYGVIWSNDLSRSTTAVSWEASSVLSMASYSIEVIWVGCYRFRPESFSGHNRFSDKFPNFCSFHRRNKQVNKDVFMIPLVRAFVWAIARLNPPGISGHISIACSEHISVLVINSSSNYVFNSWLRFPSICCSKHPAQGKGCQNA